MIDILQPAIELAKHGFPVHPVTAHFWDKGSSCLKDPKNIHGSDLLLSGQAPRAGDVMKMPLLATTFEVGPGLKSEEWSMFCFIGHQNCHLGVSSKISKILLKIKPRDCWLLMLCARAVGFSSVLDIGFVSLTLPPIVDLILSAPLLF